VQPAAVAAVAAVEAKAIPAAAKNGNKYHLDLHILKTQKTQSTMKLTLRIFTFGFLAVGLLMACKTTKVGGNVKIPADFKVEIQHMPCRGNCPTYTMVVDAFGAATYEGRRAVDKIGKYTKTLDVATLKLMSDAIETAKFFDFDEIYGGGVADVPGVITIVTMNGKSKRIEDIRNAPKELKELEAKLEELFGSDGWTAVKQ
jgi:hypothetical protein